MATETREHSFDELAKGLASGTLSRGKAIRWMGGALLGAALASFPGVAWANDDDRCPEGQTRCGERCVNLKRNERHCGSCRNRCGSNQTCCKGRCVNLKRNERHCGRCFNRCPEGQECVGGMCQGGCRSGTTPCGTQCCQTGETCLHGIACCPDAQVCGTGAFAICCTDPAHTCVDGFCECDPGTTPCAGGCCPPTTSCCPTVPGEATCCVPPEACNPNLDPTDPSTWCI
jgi:hypothetical protein